MFQEIWTDADRSSRISLIFGIFVIIAIVIAGSYWLIKEKMEVLFTDLEPREAASIVTELERMKVEHKLAVGGTQILVPEEVIYDTRLKLMASNIPMGGGVGFEIFDNSEFGMTEFAQRINFQRALQGELTRTIMSLTEVRVARVHLVLPENTLFRQNANKPTASVTLFFKRGMRLSQSQIEGIQRLVSASVPGLEPSGVTVVDNTGNTLSRIEADENGAMEVSMRLQKKQEVESYLRQKVYDVLSRRFGPDKAVVSIDVTLNFDQEKTTREEIIPQTESVSSVLRKRESQGAGKGKYRQGAKDTEVEYRLGREIAQIVSTPGNIERLSVGVIVPVGTQDEQLLHIKELIAMTVGLDISRGDAIAVHASETSDISSKDTIAYKGFVEGGIVKQESNEISHGNLMPDSDEYESEIVANERSSTQGSEGFSDQLIYIWQQYNYLFIAGFIVLILLLGYWIVRHNSAGTKHQLSHNRLSTDERERVLLQLKGWLSDDDLKTQSDTGANS